MSPEPVTAERIYHRLKNDVVDGLFPPGSTLNLQRLAQEFGASVSPLRDAVHRLVGEHLLEMHPGGGFELPVVTAETIQQLYEWHDGLIRLALRRGKTRIATLPRPFDPATVLPVPLARVTALLFEAIGAGPRNPEYLRAIRNVSDRLHVVRIQELRVMKGAASEIDSLRTIAESGSVAAFRIALSEYHRRRLRRVHRLAAMVATGKRQLRSAD
jgi:hypothetical protein